MYLSHHQPQVRRGPWIEEKTLGSGGFGTVVLWRNEETGNQLALKKCRVQSEMTPKHCHRWQLEVDIMRRLDHDNVVIALEVPEELRGPSNELPLLAMEYCSKGDLRKALNLAENCCGMQEYDIRCLTHDVAAALEYLHSRRIIHRDLKPENIVLQQVDDVIVYKLIDLGYAKELDQGSVCTSFVGTLQYLAPELFASKQYSQTVDYWSFGTVVYECITGIRPFLPTLPPVHWHREVCAKSPDDICAWIDADSEVKFSKNLLPPLSPLHIVHVLNVESNVLLAYPLKADDSMVHLQNCLELETKIPVAEQDLLLASGVSPDLKNPALQCWSEPSAEEWVVFLFRKGTASNSPRRRKLPQMLQCIVKEPRTLLPFNEQRVAWAQAVFFLQLQNKDFKRLILSQRAAMLNLLRINSKFAKLKTKMMNELEKLMARKDHFKESLEFDIQQYNEQAAGGVTSERMFSRWTRMGEDIEKYMQLKDRASQLETKSGAVTTKIVELQKSPFGKARQNDTLTECEEKAKQLFHDLRQTPKEHRSSALTDHNPMVQLVVRSVLCLDKALADLYVHLGKVMECRQDLQVIIPELERCIEEISAAGRQLTAHQQRRQQDIWMLVKVALKQVKPGLPRSNSRSSNLSNNSSGNSHGSNTPIGPVSLSSVPSDHGSGSLMSIKIMEDARMQNRRMKEMMSSMMREQEEYMSIISNMDELSLPQTPMQTTESPTSTPKHTASQNAAAPSYPLVNHAKDTYSAANNRTNCVTASNENG